jgi:DNA-binding transcriptional regulator GbsR (MarR family)
LVNPRPPALVERTPNTEEIADTLLVAHSTVSTSLNALQGWGLVRVTHVIGERRDRTDNHVGSFA